VAEAKGENVGVRELLGAGEPRVVRGYTIRLGLVRFAREVAEERGVSVSRVVEDALKLYLMVYYVPQLRELLAEFFSEGERRRLKELLAPAPRRGGKLRREGEVRSGG
jgi:hypothetical protein